MALDQQPCPACHAHVPVAVGLAIATSGLVWYRSYHCPLCGYMLEVDGHGWAPAAIREAILREEGRCGVEILDDPGGRTRALAAFRRLLNLSLEEIARVRHLVPGVVATGTRAEMHWLALELERVQVPARVLGVHQAQGLELPSEEDGS